MSDNDNKDDTVIICVIHGKPYIWNQEDVTILRQEHHILGKLVGCLPRLPRQNVQLGRPLQLLQEEATLLVEKGIAQMCNGSVPVSLPSPEEVDNFQRTRRQLYEDQVELCKVKKREEIQAHEEEIQRGRMVKRQRLLEEQKTTGQSVVSTQSIHIDTNLDDIKINTLPEKSCAVQICTATHRCTELEAAEWHYPTTEMEHTRYRVFKDLWEKGYYLTSGGKFGGDFLVYPGEPARFHSFYIAVCRPPSQSLTPLDLITLGRLGANVKKTVVLCSVDQQTDQMCYISLQWAGLS
ncbi:tRNA-splicing endonuclease subunit Sen34 [Lamellibrachia satsuma]|nr:tRNA-splicing endonuclease subunit Sen34 [Lamellibrachia satsuma]